MPIYEYLCSNCKHQFEELQSMSEELLRTCPKCGKDTLDRLIGAGSGVIFKGSGFYLTDYKKEKSKKGEAKGDDTKKEGKEKKEEVKTAKPEAKEEKPDKK